MKFIHLNMNPPLSERTLARYQGINHCVSVRLEIYLPISMFEHFILIVCTVDAWTTWERGEPIPSAVKNPPVSLCSPNIELQIHPLVLREIGSKAPTDPKIHDAHVPCVGWCRWMDATGPPPPQAPSCRWKRVQWFTGKKSMCTSTLAVQTHVVQGSTVFI